MMMSFALLLYYIFILHQTTTADFPDHLSVELYYIFILHQTTTHGICNARMEWLYYIFILHQTTTPNRTIHVDCWLYYIFILHQTTTYTTYIADIQPFENHIGRYEVVWWDLFNTKLLKKL